MKSDRLWIEIVMIAAGMACALALLLACLGTVAAVAREPKAPEAASTDSGLLQSPQNGTHEVQEPAHESVQRAYEGMVTCSHCGARHSPKSGKSAAECSRSCVYSGSQFALVEGETTYLLDGDVTLVKKFAGQRARIVGELSGNRITVSSASAT